MRDIDYVQVTVPQKLLDRVHKLPRIINRSEFLRLVFQQPANMSVKLSAYDGKRRFKNSKSQRWAKKLEENLDWVLRDSKNIHRALKYPYTR